LIIIIYFTYFINNLYFLIIIITFNKNKTLMFNFIKGAFPWLLYGVGVAIYIKYMNSKAKPKNKKYKLS
ncbi:hypothetical protein, partial [uncultured Clostridium sp.]|uniref:hypothetical protein n=1 Tax=uncultured Clostridium sp. TaxID=59620 RepID=UPI00267218D5